MARMDPFGSALRPTWHLLQLRARTRCFSPPTERFGHQGRCLLLHFPARCIELASCLRRGDPVLRRRVLSLWVQSVGLRAAVSVGRGGALLARSEGLLAATTLQVNLRSRIVW